MGSISTVAWPLHSPLLCHRPCLRPRAGHPQWNALKSLTTWNKMRRIQMPKQDYESMSQMILGSNFSFNFTFSNSILKSGNPRQYSNVYYKHSCSICLFFRTILPTLRTSQVNYQIFERIAELLCSKKILNIKEEINKTTLLYRN